MSSNTYAKSPKTPNKRSSSSILKKSVSRNNNISLTEATAQRKIKFDGYDSYRA